MRRAVLLEEDLMGTSSNPRPMTWNDDSGFGEDAFTLELTSTSGSTLSQDFQSFAAGALVETSLQFE